MVLQVRTDRHFILHHIDAHCPKMFGRAYARQHQDLRAVKCARRQDHRAARFDRTPIAALANLNPCHAALMRQQFFGHRIGDDMQMQPRWFNIGSCRRPPLAAFLSDLIQAKSLLLCPVKIIVPRQLQLRRRLYPRAAARVGIMLIHYI